jgi:hypothetical protein
MVGYLEKSLVLRLENPKARYSVERTAVNCNRHCFVDIRMLIEIMRYEYISISHSHLIEGVSDGWADSDGAIDGFEDGCQLCVLSRC